MLWTWHVIWSYLFSLIDAKTNHEGWSKNRETERRSWACQHASLDGWAFWQPAKNGSKEVNLHTYNCTTSAHKNIRYMNSSWIWVWSIFKLLNFLRVCHLDTLMLVHCVHRSISQQYSSFWGSIQCSTLHGNDLPIFVYIFCVTNHSWLDLILKKILFLSC